MFYHQPTQTIWFGTDANTIGRATPPLTIFFLSQAAEVIVTWVLPSRKTPRNELRYSHRVPLNEKNKKMATSKNNQATSSLGFEISMKTTLLSRIWNSWCFPALLIVLMIGYHPQLSSGKVDQSTTETIEPSSLGKLGTLDFPTSGSKEAQPHFLRGVAALHSFWYEEAIDAFRRSTAIDPNFAMGYWGEAMAHNHPVWNEENLEAARTALRKIPNNAPLTDRESRYIHAVQILFGEGNKRIRDQTYVDHMKSLAGEYTEDLEATCFYALSLLGVATHFDNDPDRQEKYRVQAGALTLGVYGVNPKHPCAAHYTIHAFDDPIHAILALPQARRYANIAPEAHHAQHMPAHIFVQLGMWDEAAASNKAGWDSSRRWVKNKQLPLALQDYHSLNWLQYAYLQQGRYNAAAALILDKQHDMSQSSTSNQSHIGGYNRPVSRSYDQMVAAFVIETERWGQARQAWQVKDIPLW